MPNGLECLEGRLAEIEQTTIRAKPLYYLTIIHEKVVAEYARKIALELHLNQDVEENVELGARFHDIGKVAWPEEVYARKMSEQEKKEYKDTHNIGGFEIVKEAASGLDVKNENLEVILNAIKYHHERYDGNTKCKYYAYPGEYNGGSIPLPARIITVVDHFDAMISNRPYRKKEYTAEEALGDLVLKKETEYDPEIVDVFVSIMQKCVI